MNISILTVFPELYEPFLKTSLIGRAVLQGTVSFDLTSFFSYSPPKQRIDARAFGHGAGMVMRPEIVGAAIEDKEKVHGKAFKIFFSPQGRKLTQPVLKEIADRVLQANNHLMIVSSRYEGMDDRIEQNYADLTISIGDFVLMGGDVPAMVLLEGLLRLIPGVVGKAESVEYESFNGPFVDFPTYTTPVIWNGWEVPPVLRSGNHAAINKWREDQAIEKTVKHHFEWVRSYALSAQQKKQAAERIPPHYCVLMHSNVMLPNGEVGTTSVTSMDIHDIARSARTYGLKNYFIVTELEDQTRVVQTLLDFWQTGYGIEYNKNRHEAVKRVSLKKTFDEVVEAIKEREGVAPIVLATSAKTGSAQSITYFDQERVWSHKKPVLFVLGTGKGLSPELMNRADYVLEPVEGFTDFNHLSVRTAAGVIFDRWLGLQHKAR
ncbi:MAG: tRNA (guanine-N(1)-)-methyltransferase [Candidatus Dependentiae bacterium ADurb.Bin331]|nr:MAG: tRNA (guanine-N(1)-)-methyltransferase [Candidatus Dependentiae bacterium ADurb.Bin331]